MTEKVQAKFVFKNVFRTVDDWLKNKEQVINKETDIQNYMSDENDDLVFRNAYKNFDQYVNNVFQSDQTIKDYLRGRNQEQQKIYDSKFFKNVFSRSLEHQHYIKSKNNNSSPQHSPTTKNVQSKILHPLNLKKLVNRSPDVNINASTTSYGSFREKGRNESDFLNKTSRFFQTTSKLSKNSFPQVKVHKFKLQDHSLKSPSKLSKEGSSKFINNSFKEEGSLKVNINAGKDGSINNSSSKALPIIELEADKLLEMKMPDEQMNIHDYLKDSADNLIKVENDIFNSHFLSSKMLFKDSTDGVNNSSTTFYLQNSKRLLGDSEFIPPPKRLFNKETHQQLYVNIYRLHNLLKEESQKELKFNLRLPISCIQILNMLFEFTLDDLYKTLSQVIQNYIFCFDTNLTDILASHLKINFQNKVYSYWELVTEISNLVDSSKRGNEAQIQSLQSSILKLTEDLNLLQKENEEYKNNLSSIQKRCETQFNSEKAVILEQLSQKTRENSKLSDEISLYKKQLKTQEGIFLQNEAEMKMYAKQLEVEFASSIQQMEKNIKDLNSQNTSQSNKIFIMQDSYATQLVRDRILDLESKISLIIEENSRLNARAGTNFFELTPRPSFSSLDQIINPNAPILSQDIFRKTTQYVNFKQKSSQKKVQERAKLIQNYINSIKESYENKIHELTTQQQVIQHAAEQKKKIKQSTKHNQKGQKDTESRNKSTVYQANSQVSKASILLDNEDPQTRSGNENELERINSNQKKPTLTNNLSFSQQHSKDFDYTPIY